MSRWRRCCPRPPQPSATANSVAGHVAVIRGFVHRLPDFVDIETRAKAEAQLARLAGEHRPDELAKLADKLTDCLNPDGDFTEHDRARRRGLTLGRQDIDGMSPIKGYLTPEARATLDAVLAKLAAPGMCNPDDEAPCVDGPPPEQAVGGDSRTCAQRNHDALNAGLRALLSSGELGQHNGLPASIIVTTTLRELEAAAGRGLTGGGTLLPMSDVIRLAGHAHHYLAIFDSGKALALYHTKRLASPAQRIVLYAKDRGCSFPNCEVPGLPLRSPPPRSLRHQSGHRCQPADFRLLPQPQTRRPRLDHPQKPPRRHRMDPPTPPRPRPTPHQHLPPPRKTPTRR